MKEMVKLSKFLSYMLRHRPDQFGLVMDDEGFTDLEAVWAQVEKRFGARFSRQDLTTLVEDTPFGKQRLEIRDGRIRALYGHSKVAVDYPPVEPPEILYHVTTPEAVKFIRKEGLKSQKRQFVHLSTTIERASNVATRHGKPVILRIRALEAHKAGHVFHHPEPQHFLVRSVPPEFIEFP
jgi:putative RNA 2'-phosphotransferase